MTAATQDVIEAVQQSYDRCLSRVIDGKGFLEAFYHTFFNSDPSIRPMFERTDMQKQAGLLKHGLNMLILYSSGWPSAKTAMEKIAFTHNHEHYNVRPEMYDLWAKSLMSCVRKYDKDFTPALAAQWDAAISPGIAMMRENY